MATTVTDYAEEKLVKHVAGVASYTMPTPYLALYTVTPGKATSGTELSGNGYARVAAAGATFTYANGVLSNTAAVTFPTATGNQGTIVGIALVDASTAGNILWAADLGSVKTLTTGDSLTFPIGAISFNLNS